MIAYCSTRCWLSERASHDTLSNDYGDLQLNQLTAIWMARRSFYIMSKSTKDCGKSSFPSPTEDLWRKVIVENVDTKTNTYSQQIATWLVPLALNSSCHKMERGGVGHVHLWSHSNHWVNSHSENENFISRIRNGTHTEVCATSMALLLRGHRRTTSTLLKTSDEMFVVADGCSCSRRIIVDAVIIMICCTHYFLA